MSIDSLLVRYRGGYFIETATDSTGPGGRGYLELGQVEALAEARSIAQLELARLKDPLVGITAEPDPRPTSLTDAAFVGWLPGDYVTTLNRFGVAEPARCRQIEVEQDDDSGALTITPALASRLEEQDVRLQRIIRRRLNGTLEGRSSSTGSAQPAESVRVRRITKSTVEFNWSGSLVDYIDQVNGPKQWEVDGRLVQIKFSCGATLPTTEPIDIGLFRNGVLWATYSIPIGTRTHFEFPQADVTRSQWWDMAIADVDGTAEGLTAEMTAVFWDAA